MPSREDDFAMKPTTRSRILTRSLILVPAVAFVALLAVATVGRSGAPRPGEAVPDFRAPLLQGGGELALEDLRGRPAVLNFWASWCVPCADEAPLLRDAHETYGDDIAFVGIDIRDARSDALAFVERFDLEYPSVRDEGLVIFQEYGLTGQPETFFIDSEGILVAHVPGPVDEQQLADMIDLLLRRDA